MHIFFLSLFLLQAEPTAKAPTQMEKKAVAQMAENTKSVMLIDPKSRADDYKAAFNVLKQEKSTSKVVFDLADGQKISNVIDMTMMPNNTIVIFRYSTPKGIKFQAVEIENIVGIMHQ